MKFKLTKKQYNLLVSLNGLNDFISNPSDEENNVVFEVSDIGGFQNEIYFNIVEDGMDKEGQVNSKGKEMYLIYDTLLAQI